jgi:transposase
MDEFELTTSERHRLENQLKHAKTARLFRRTLAVLEASRGKSVPAISAMLGASRRSVYRWIEAYRHGHDPEVLLEGEHTGRPSLWGDENEAVLQCLLEHRPNEFGYYAVNWTAPLLKLQLEHTTGDVFAEDTIREKLRRLGYVWKRGRYELLPDPELEKKKTDSPSDPQFAARNAAVRGG